MRSFAACALLLLAIPPVEAADPGCVPSGVETSVEEIADRVETEGLRYVFIGEEHGVGPVKRFAVDAVNALADRGHQVGLYVEGFRTGCPPERAGCGSLAEIFNPEAFGALLSESRGRVHPIDPPELEARVARMAAVIGGGPETIRVVLVGRSHVIHAGDAAAEHRVFGGAMRYPDPGDLAEAFPRAESLTISLEPADETAGDYALVADGCRADYALLAAPVTSYRPGPPAAPARAADGGHGAPATPTSPRRSPPGSSSRSDLRPTSR